MGGFISGWAYKRNKRCVSERRDKTYQRNELKITYHCILSYICNNTFVVRHNKRIIYFRKIYKTLMRLEQLERNRWA